MLRPRGRIRTSVDSLGPSTRPSPALQQRAAQSDVAPRRRIPSRQMTPKGTPMRSAAASIVLFGTILGLGSAVQAGDVPLTTVRVASGLYLPVFATHAPGDFDRLFILEKRGIIRILNLKTGTLNADAVPEHRSARRRRHHHQQRAGTARTGVPPRLPEERQVLRRLHEQRRQHDHRAVHGLVRSRCRQHGNDAHPLVLPAAGESQRRLDRIRAQ